MYLLDPFTQHRDSERKVLRFCSMVQTDNEFHQRTMRERQSAHRRFLKAAIPLAVAVERSGAQRAPILKYADQHPAAKADRSPCVGVLDRLRAA